MSLHPNTIHVTSLVLVIGGSHKAVLLASSSRFLSLASNSLKFIEITVKLPEADDDSSNLKYGELRKTSSKDSSISKQLSA